jgi:hypothetical protein
MSSAASTPVSKRQFLNALVCPTMAFRDRHATSPALETATQWRFHEGNRVGALARTVLGGGRMLPPPFSETALVDSAAAIAEGGQTLFEATMSAAGMIARADALVPCADGWELIEVKSGKMPESGIASADYINDIAFTLCVAQMAGVPVVRASLMLLSRAYVRGADEPFFGRLEVTAAAMVRAAELRPLAPAIVDAIRGSVLPAPSLRMACKHCAYFATSCIGQGVDDSVLRIPRLTEKKLGELLPHERIGELPASTKLTPVQQQAVDVIKARQAQRNAKVLADLALVRWPAFYLDFESVMPAFPWFDGDRAYATLPNQYSVHVCAAPGSVYSHTEYLAPFDADWRRDLAERLLDALAGEGSIVVYSPYEKTQLSAMAERFPDLAPRIAAVIGRLFDLERFFKSGYVHHGYAGSSSIKKVLPVLVPALTYETMAVGNGSDASALFCLMREGVIGVEEHAARRRELLEYCKLDTLAMVHLHDVLTTL